MCLVPREFLSRVPPTLLTDAVADSEGRLIFFSKVYMCIFMRFM